MRYRFASVRPELPEAVRERVSQQPVLARERAAQQPVLVREPAWERPRPEPAA